MAKLHIPARRLILTGGFAAVVASAPLLTALAAPSAAPAFLGACPNGESADTYTSACTPDLVPNSPEIQSAPGGLPEVEGIPCTGGNSGQCIGLSEEQESQGPIAQPNSSVGSSPTVTGSTN